MCVCVCVYSHTIPLNLETQSGSLLSMCCNCVSHVVDGAGDWHSSAICCQHWNMRGAKAVDWRRDVVVRSVVRGAVSDQSPDTLNESLIFDVLHLHSQGTRKTWLNQVYFPGKFIQFSLIIVCIVFLPGVELLMMFLNEIKSLWMHALLTNI